MRTTLALACLFIIGLSAACQVYVPVTPIRVTPTDRLPEREDDKALVLETPLETDPGPDDEPAVPTATLSPPTQAFELCSPLPLHPLAELPDIISDPYNPPPQGREERHHGVDFGYYHYQERDSMLGEPVQAILPGIVAAAIHDLYPYGNMVMIETPFDSLPDNIRTRIKISSTESLYILYAHMDRAPSVNLSERVEVCQPLGEVGKSGNADIPHLHLETRLGPAGVVFKSMRFYDTRATVEEMDNYKLWRTSGMFRHFDPMNLLTP